MGPRPFRRPDVICLGTLNVDVDPTLEQTFGLTEHRLRTVDGRAIVLPNKVIEVSPAGTAGLAGKQLLDGGLGNLLQ